MATKGIPRIIRGTTKMQNSEKVFGNDEMLKHNEKAKQADQRMRELLFKHHRTRLSDSTPLGTNRPRPMSATAFIPTSSPLANF